MMREFKGMELTIALYYVCMGYHSGQDSRGYRILSKSCRRLKRRGIDMRYVDYRRVTKMHPEVVEMAGCIISKYGNTL